MTDTLPLAFVLMPFDAEFDDVYSDLIQKPLQDAGYVVRRADSLLNQRSVLQDVVKGIADAELVVADVSGLNPNVLYELGLAHALGKRTIMITRSIEELPFDLRPYRANAYSTRFTEAAKLASTLTEIGEAVLRGEADFSNPVQDYAPYALMATSQVTQPPRPREPSAAQSPGPDDERGGEDDDSDPGLLEVRVSFDEATERVVEILSEVGAATREIGDAFTAQTDRLELAHKNLGEKGAGVYLSIMRDAAKQLNAYSDRLEPLNANFRQDVAEIALTSNAMARARTIEDEADRISVQEDIDAISSAEDELVEAYVHVSDFAKNIASLPHMDSQLSKAARRGARVVSDTADIIEIAQSEFARSRLLLEERLSEAPR
jgi:hypothetical protein